MKFVTLADGTRDGRAYVVSRDGTRVVPVVSATTMLDVMENWDRLQPELKQLSAIAEGGGKAFDPAEALSIFPRAVQWLDGSAFETHALLLQQAWGMPTTGLPERPLMYQGMSDRFLAPTETAVFPSVTDGIDFEGEFGVVLGDVPMGTTAAEAGRYIRLIVVINDWSLRALGPGEMKTGFGWLQCKPATALAPFAVTPEELGRFWQDSRVCLPLNVARNDSDFGHASGAEMKFGFDELIAHAAYSRDLPAGTILGSGTVSNAAYGEVGSSCIAERRAIEQIKTGAGRTAFMMPGDTVTMQAHHPEYGNVFGQIRQSVAIAKAARRASGAASASNFARRAEQPEHAAHMD